MPRELVDLTIEEVSAVDHPANRRKWLVIKRRDAVRKLSGEELDEPLTTDQVLAYQQERERLWRAWWDLQDAFRCAIESIGRHGDDSQRPMMIRQSVEEFVSRAVPLLEGMGAIDKAAASLATLRDVAKAGRKISADRMRRLKEAMDALAGILEEAEMPEPKDEMEKLQKQVDGLTAEVETLKADKATLETQNQALRADLEKRQEPAPTLTDPEERRKAALAKMDPETRAIFEEQHAIQKAQEDRLAKAEAEAKRERDERRKQEAIQKARSYTAAGINPDDHYTIFMKLDAGDVLSKEEVAEVYRLLKSAGEVAVTAGVFKQFGSDGRGDGEEETAEREIIKRVRAEQEKVPTLSYAEALRKVYQDDHDLYERYQAEQRAKVRVPN